MNDAIKKINDTNGFNAVQQALFEIFDDLGIATETYQHPPIFTVEEGMALDLHTHIPGQGGKSLFLKNAKDELWLVVACEETRVDLKSLSDRVQTKRFSFARPELMVEILGVTPGSATPFALMNDKDRKVNVVIDEKFQDTTHCVFHPLENTYSTVISIADLMRFIRFLGYNPVTVPLA